MDALPLTRHDWHGDWNYTLRPESYDQVRGAPDPFDQPSPGLAWLCCPALTGLPAREWDALVAMLMTLHDEQRETSLDKRRGHRPRLAAPGTGRRPALTLADRLLATVLHQRLALHLSNVFTKLGISSRSQLHQALSPHLGSALAGWEWRRAANTGPFRRAPQSWAAAHQAEEPLRARG